MLDGMHSTSLDRIVSRNNNSVVSRVTQKHPQQHIEINDDHRHVKKADSIECLQGKPILFIKNYITLNFISDSSPKVSRSTIRTTHDKDHPLSSSTQNKGVPPSPPKPSTTNWRRSLLVNPNEQESNSTIDPIYGNVHVSQRIKKKELSIDDEAGLIEHDLLNLVEQEQKKEEQNTPPALPIKKRAATTTTVPDNPLDVEIEPTMKLVHPGKDRPRRANVRPPVKRSANGSTNDSSSDGGLLTDENDDNSTGDTRSKPTSEILMNSSSFVDPQTNELPPT
jgi:hypothetical protein